MKSVKIISFIILALAAVFIGVAYADEKESQLDLCKKSLIEAIDIINSNSLKKIDKLELPQVNSADQCESAFESLLKQLNDKNSDVLTPEEIEESENEEEPYAGIGVTISQSKNSVVGPVIKIEEIWEGGPAQKAKLKENDLIIEIDDIPTKDITLKEATKLIKGPTETEVKLKITRLIANRNEILIFRIKREIVSYNPVIVGFINSEIGYIKIKSFSFKNANIINKRIAEGLIQLELDDEIKSYIVDLRDNPGGYVETAVYMISLFLKNENQEITFLIIKGNGSSYPYSTSKGERLIKKEPIIILVNKGSASASEMVAGALQYHKKAILIGTKTYGKGVITISTRLDNGYRLKITAEKYYFPNGFSPEGVGIAPDIIVENDDQKPGDEQLEKAVEVMTDLLGLKMDKDDKKPDSEQIEKDIEIIDSFPIGFSIWE